MLKCIGLKIADLSLKTRIKPGRASCSKKGMWQQEGHLACKNWYWHGYLSGVWCK